MQYDPVKKFLGSAFSKSPWLRKLFYRILDLHLLRTWHVRKAIKQWRKVAPEKPVILDAGSGFGQYVFHLSGKFPRASILGVDIDRHHIDDCTSFFRKIRRNNVSFKSADLTEFVQEETFDLILAIDVMEHIANDQKVFENFFRSLRKKGVVIITTPSDKGGSDVKTHHPYHHSDDNAKANLSFIDEHVRDGYNMEEMRQKLAEQGFSDIQIFYTYGWPGKISWKLAMKYPMTMLGFSRWLVLILPVYFILLYWFILLLNFLDVRLKHASGTGLLVTAVK